MCVFMPKMNNSVEKLWKGVDKCVIEPDILFSRFGK